MDCPFCNHGEKLLPDKKHQLSEHLVVTLDKKNHFHVHGPTKKTDLIMQMLVVIAREAGIILESNDEEENQKIIETVIDGEENQKIIETVIEGESKDGE